MKRFLSTAIIAASMVLTGCATTYSSQVSVFHEWPQGNQDKSYILERLPAQENNPEYKFYEEELRTQLGLHGFKEIAVGATPALKIGMQYGTTMSELQYSSAWHPAMYDPFWNMHFRRAYLYDPYFPYYGRRLSGPIDINVTRYYLHQLEIDMSDFASNKKLASIRVSSEQTEPEISKQMPYLIESALQGFPGKNGSTTNVELPFNKEHKDTNK
ncbi:DUF4136 domain-containing protein [Undibacterium jejuense]|uniref:DUF4136 domain-containing protein n=1 Tax=Undibacterium jejuense TaxID=1344949 RepID=A0A923KR64_9BURK|nr:DUF4136 domain-containing protein [Undibacterium jejuense]MBC3863729.1 DUF4136 domain-containing protein [Undibacterium jejuense]